MTRVTMQWIVKDLKKVMNHYLATRERIIVITHFGTAMQPHFIAAGKSKDIELKAGERVLARNQDCRVHIFVNCRRLMRATTLD